MLFRSRVGSGEPDESRGRQPGFDLVGLALEPELLAFDRWSDFHFPPALAPVKFRGSARKLSLVSDDITVMRFLPPLFASLCLALLAAPAARATAAPATKAAAPTTAASTGPKPVWETGLQNFDSAIYSREVEKLITQFEASTGKRVAPGPKKKVGLKIYTDSGEGLATPKALTLAVIEALERRGFEPEIGKAHV